MTQDLRRPACAAISSVAAVLSSTTAPIFSPSLPSSSIFSEASETTCWISPMLVTVSRTTAAPCSAEAFVCWLAAAICPAFAANLEAGVEQVYASYGAWTSLGHLALYDIDGNRMWLTLAEENARALTSALRDAQGSYALQHFHCVGRLSLDCESGEMSWVNDWTLDTAAQAWTQHLNVAIARRLVATSGTASPLTAPELNRAPRSGAP